MRTLIVLAACALLLVSCAPQQPDTAGLKKTVDDYIAASKDDMLNGNSAKAMSFYEDDAMELAPNMVAVKGKEAIKTSHDQMMKMGMKFVSVEFSPMEVVAGGTIGHVIGTYDMTISVPQMGDVKDKGKYITLWAQQPDGKWKVRAETWNSDTPMPSMDQAPAKKGDMKKK